MDVSKIKIHELVLNDIPDLIRYRIQYLIEMQGQRDEEYIERLSTELYEYFESSILTGSFIIMAAKIDDKIVAFGGMVLKKIPGDMNNPHYIEADILNIYTVPEARKKGISKMILLKLIEKAKILGITKLSLHTSKEGENLYRSLGFSDPAFPYLEFTLI